MPKWGAEFISPGDGRQQEFRFSDAWDKSMPYAYQVRRSEFDRILIRHAERAGAEVIEGARVCEVDLEGSDSQVLAEVQHEDGVTSRWRARFLLDASGRDTFL